MCGIIGYVGGRSASEVLLQGLRKLEYRGYDSAGAATICKNSLEIIKDIGRVDEIHKKHDLLKLQGNTGIGHTRWATHGRVTKQNAHPHLSNDGKIAVVHNGIVENYQGLKRMLQQNGFVFESETDTEVIPNLIEHEMTKGKNFVEAAKTVLQELEGNYAILVLHKDENKIVATRNGSPLVIGVGRKEYFVASDIPAFLDYTSKIIYLCDRDIAVLDNHIKIFNLSENRKVYRPIDTIKWSVRQAKKGKFEHFMLKEISEQNETIKKAIQQDEKSLIRLAEQIKQANGVFFVACGSSYHACLAASYIFSKIANMHINVVVGSEFSNYEHFLKENTLVVAVSQSGETADVLEAVKIAKKKNSRIASIVNVAGSSLHRNSDASLLMNAGPEICVLSTKTYTSQLAILILLAYTAAGKLKEGKKELEYLYNLVYNLTAASTRGHLKNLAEKLKENQHLFTIGRSLQYATALEAALKIKEVSYIHAEGFAGGELKHGTIALIEKNTPCIVFVSEENEKETISNAMELKSRGAYIIGIASKNNEIFDFFIKVPEVGLANPICQIIPMQILAYQLALLRGCDPDYPRNLAKSVTVK